MAASLIPRSSLAHWEYTNLIVEGEVIGEPYQYVCQSNASSTPLQIVNSTGMRSSMSAVRRWSSSLEENRV